MISRLFQANQKVACAMLPQSSLTIECAKLQCTTIDNIAYHQLCRAISAKRRKRGGASGALAQLPLASCEYSLMAWDIQLPFRNPSRQVELSDNGQARGKYCNAAVLHIRKWISLCPPHDAEGCYYHQDKTPSWHQFTDSTMQ